MLGDALVYGCSLYVIKKGKKAQARSAMLKGSIMFLTAIAVFARATYQLFAQTVPTVQLMVRNESNQPQVISYRFFQLSI